MEKKNSRSNTVCVCVCVSMSVCVCVCVVYKGVNSKGSEYVNITFPKT